MRQRFFDEGADSFDATFERLGYEIWANQNQEAYFIAAKIDSRLAERCQHHSDGSASASRQTPSRRWLGSSGSIPRRSWLPWTDTTLRIGPGGTDRTIRDGKATLGIDPPKSNWATPIDHGPFIAYPLTCAITFTFGGIRSDARARVLRRDGTPIEGLYAAGEVTGLYYQEYPAGTSVLRALTFGRIAAREAAGARG